MLAATLSPSYGIYSGYRVRRARAGPAGQRGVPGLREVRGQGAHARRRRCCRSSGCSTRSRRAHPALQHLSNITFLDTRNDGAHRLRQAHGRRRGDHRRQPRPAVGAGGPRHVPDHLGLPPAFQVQDLLDGSRYDWHVGGNYVRLAPATARRTFRVAPGGDRARSSDPRRTRPSTRFDGRRGPAAARRRRAEQLDGAKALPTPRLRRPAHWFERDPLWFKRRSSTRSTCAAFFDGNDDGSGDFRGLTEKLDYLQWLGVDCIWLLPMFAVAAARRRLRHRRLLRRSTPTTGRSRTSAPSSWPPTSAASASSPTSS